jgi:hypothetical protein
VKRTVSAFLLLILSIAYVHPYKILYAEQFYRLYHLHFYQNSDNTMENISWLEQALKADFCNPLYALAKIDNREEWKHYRYLFKMHVNLKLVELYRALGSRYDKQVAYFYNAPWKRQNLESLEIAEKMYRIALYYWREALSWAKKLSFSPHHLEEIQRWEDEKHKIQTGELDYRDIIEEQLTRLRRVRLQFQSMDEGTF